MIYVSLQKHGDQDWHVGDSFSTKEKADEFLEFVVKQQKGRFLKDGSIKFRDVKIRIESSHLE